MRRLVGFAYVAVLYLVSGSVVWGEERAALVLDKAIKALGGEERLRNVEAFSWKAKWHRGGTIYESQVTIQGLDHWRHEIRKDSFHVLQVVSGDKGWSRSRGVTRKISGQIGDVYELAVYKHHVYLDAISVTLVPIKTEGFKYQAADDEKVGDKPASVLKITGPDREEFMLFFDKVSGLPGKEVEKYPDTYGHPVVKETTFAEYKEFGGIKKATRLEFKTNGQTDHVLELTEFKILDKVVPDTFSEPK
jgi:hypothetical protein